VFPDLFADMSYKSSVRSTRFVLSVLSGDAVALEEVAVFESAAC